MPTDGKDKKEELNRLRAEAASFGIDYKANWGEKKLQDAIRKAAEEDGEQEVKTKVDELAAKDVGEKEMSIAELKSMATKKGSKLVRCTVTCLDPRMSIQNGEFVSTGNDLVGQFRKFIQWGVPYHIPYAIYNKMKDDTFIMYVDKQKKVGGVMKTFAEPTIMKKYVIEVLPNLTKDELEALAKKQAMTAD